MCSIMDHPPTLKQAPTFVSSLADPDISKRTGADCSLLHGSGSYLFIVCDNKPCFYIHIYIRYEYVHIYTEEIVMFVVQIFSGSGRLAVNIAN